ncbi:MAG: transglycosylase domain-containing protein [Clostridia bacterium]|nr:transglycosylase domain-containing protein [Clostridia bacterium]MBR2176703.1 transglycosylase domain-containing protein [Clostridia bacterium]
MRKTDISNFTEETSSGSSVSAGSMVGGVFSTIRKFLVTALMIFLITGFVVGISIVVYLIGIANEPLNIDLNKIKLSLTSFVWVPTNDEGTEFEKYQELYSSENRVWVKYQDIPKHMIDAQIAIEDKRFWDHKGVDWYRTGGAVFSLATGQADFGGSTITQQLIKNITQDNEVSITRKLREISRALKLEEEYSKDDIIEAYLNVVNYGAGCRGVQSAANLYFNKKIEDCSIAECAAIAGITQNPYAFDPLVYPENNKDRREDVIDAMYDQGLISKKEYDEALKESADMTFVGYIIEDDDDDDENDWNWYMDRVFRDVVSALEDELHVGRDYAEDLVYNGGLNIYSAMDKKAQEIAEKKIKEWQTPNDPTLDVGYELMDFEGRVLATVGGRDEKDGRLLWDNATQSTLQPGSTIKPISSYVLALDEKKINFSSLVSDRPVSDWDYVDGNNVSGPNNWYLSYYGDIPVTRALNISSNAAAVSTLNMVGLDTSYNFLTEKLNFQHLDPDHDSENLAGLSIGGFYGGVTVEEMTGSYMMFGNGGYYYEPYTYFYVEDSDGNVILDNRDRGKPEQIISTETATIMNRLLHDVVNAGGEALGFRAQINGWDIIGKTGTTDSSCDNWFVGASPYAVAGIWTGHSTPAPIEQSEQSQVHYLWRDIMQEYLKDKPQKSYNLGGDVIQHNYVIADGMLTDYTVDGKTAVGYYTSDNMPGYSSFNPNAGKQTENSGSDDPDEPSDVSDEPTESSQEPEPEPEPEPESSAEPEPEPEPQPEPEPEPEPEPGGGGEENG